MSRIARLGAFIVATLAVLAVGVFIIGSKAYLFRSTYQLRTQFADVAGLTAGADVQVGGVHSGTVNSITLPRKPGELITVVMSLDKATHEIIKHDSVASIETEGLLGSHYLAITFGSLGQAEVRDGDQIQSAPPLKMSDILIKANRILASSQQVIDNTTQATAHLNAVSAKIDSGQGSVGALINDRDLYSNLQQSTFTLKETMVQAQSGATGFRENMDALKHNFLLRGYFNKRGYEDAAELTENEINQLPTDTPEKIFTFSSQQLFDEHDSVKLHNQKSLNECGEYLARNPFGLAIVVVSTGMQGDAPKAKILTEVRALSIRAYLVQHFGFDDSQLKTLGLGKQPSAASETAIGTVQILIYSVGEAPPADKQAPKSVTSKVAAIISAPTPERRALNEKP